MSLLDAIAREPLVLLIPFISAFVGWFTNVVAVRMMFSPLEPVGWPPLLGWQGIIPANARKLARESTRLMTERILRLEALFEGFDPERFVGELDQVVEDVAGEVVREIAAGPLAAMWEGAGEAGQRAVREMVRAEVRKVAVKILGDLRENIAELLDLGRVVEETVERDKAVVGDMFRTVGAAEFRFIERSGLWFGFPFGLVQMAVWAVYPAWWILPLAGFGVGYLTNWIAIKLIFEPREPVKVGPVVLHGLFHKRQREVVARYAEMVSERVFNPENVVRGLTSGPGRERLLAIFRRRVEELADELGAHPMAAMLPEEVRRAMVGRALERLEADLDRPGGFLHVFAARAIDVRGRIVEQMSALSGPEFEGVLRPAFKQDEWKLILAGAALGLGAGVLQVVYLFGEMVL